MNQFQNLPAYMALVADDSQKNLRKIAFRSLLIAFVIITVFIFSGDFIFKVFGITIVSFKNCWWIVAVIGYHMINSNHSLAIKEWAASSKFRSNVYCYFSSCNAAFAGPEQLQLPKRLMEVLRNQLITVVAFCYLLCLVLISY